MVRNRVAPSKSVSIPGPKLSSAVLAATVARTVRRCFKSIWASSFWMYPRIVLHRTHKDRSHFGTLIESKLTIPHDSTDVEDWRHLKSASSPTELLSRRVKNLQSLETRTNGTKLSACLRSISQWATSAISPSWRWK